jgi:putative transposase
MWLKEIPYDTRDGAIRQLASNFKTAFSQLKKKQISHFKINFKSKRNPTQVCFVNKAALNGNNLFSRRVKDTIKIKEKIDGLDYGSFTIVKNKKKYFLCLPLKRKCSNLNTPNMAVALDPGVRTFQTFYSEEGLVGKFGNNVSKAIQRIQRKEDCLKSKLDTDKALKRRTRYNLRERCSLLRTKVKNTVNELHKKTCSYLTRNFKCIFLPEFNTQAMVKKKLLKRKISKATARSMMTLSHFSFKQRLLHMAKYRGCKVIICSEAYTSKTCGCCGNLKQNLSGAKMYDCSKCGVYIDRDYNGARNIYLRNTQQ